jgi:hypothetical protein
MATIPYSGSPLIATARPRTTAGGNQEQQFMRPGPVKAGISPRDMEGSGQTVHPDHKKKKFLPITGFNSLSTVYT